MKHAVVSARMRQILSERIGAAAIEFAILAPIVFALVFSIFEAGWIMTQSIMLDRAVSRTSRALQINGAKLTYAQFKAAVCSEAIILSDCVKSIRVEFTPISSATDFPTNATPCVDRSLAIDPVTTYTAGQPSQIIFTRACYVVNPLIPGLGMGLSFPKDATGGIRLTSSFAFVNEPI
ncbi:TadE/TadG family type IV pilus assembly protein [Rhizobium sp. S96]|uniref:TadE/TadG family type IV pilus assembly protein n=1 Tax=Rhizobium sp. S96 TaxID=3055140 RepID=UPI0025AA80AF|nr:TadE/TadG family type IV pilus assembly protein [Rhizobium sp. S96]MDM9623819.1 pilus assembly protein [Rhizobium sp. S96]